MHFVSNYFSFHELCVFQSGESSVTYLAPLLPWQIAIDRDHDPGRVDTLRWKIALSVWLRHGIDGCCVDLVPSSLSFSTSYRVASNAYMFVSLWIGRFVNSWVHGFVDWLVPQLDSITSCPIYLLKFYRMSFPEWIRLPLKNQRRCFVVEKVVSYFTDNSSAYMCVICDSELTKIRALSASCSIVDKKGLRLETHRGHRGSRLLRTRSR